MRTLRAGVRIRKRSYTIEHQYAVTDVERGKARTEQQVLSGARGVANVGGIGVLHKLLTPWVCLVGHAEQDH